MGTMSEEDLQQRGVRVGIQGGDTRSDLDSSIHNAMARLDDRGRRRREAAAVAAPQPITDDMPLGLQVHLAKMGAPDHRTTPADDSLPVRQPRGSISTRSSQPDEDG